ncbi:hypothetical protein FRC00_010673 [Tulasnella sp. 408]|nr:hypothetical protein FRC00_010673 [Tulasnella sp. 408]
MDSESPVGVHIAEEYMASHGSSHHYQPPASSSEGVEYTPLKEDPPPSLLPTWLMVMGFILVCFWIWRGANRYWENYQRRQAVLERRRRAGIPDEDTRPFEIAYAEAALRRREKDEERRRKELEQASTSQQQDSDWSRLGRTISHSQDPRYEARPYSANLVQRRPVTQPHVVQPPVHLPLFDYNRNSQGTLPLRGMQPMYVPLYAWQIALLNVRSRFGSESPTISSSDSPPNPPPPVWQDQYAPPEIKAQHDRQREQAFAAVTTTSSLGRRSRKHLFLDGDSNSEADIPSRVRRRTNQWGTTEAIDGDNNARWATSNNVLGQVRNDPVGVDKGEATDTHFPQGQGQRRIRKRDAEVDSDIENEDPRAKSKRKVDAELPSIPGQFKSPTSDQTTHASAISGPGKRKAREDEEATEIDDGKGQQPSTKQKKRVRVLSYHESRQGDAGPVDEEMVEGEDEQELAPEPIRQPGEEWTADGKKYKMDEDGVVRILGYVKEETTTVHPGRYSPKRSIKTAIRAKWLTLEEYADAETAGTLVPGMQEEYISIEQHPLSRAGSEAPSDWSAAVGQTPLKTGGMKTGLGSDRHPPPFASLPHAGNLPVEQHRLLHLASPARKGMMIGGKSLRPMGSQSQWERKQAEAKAMEALREARRKAKAEATPAPAVRTAATVAVIGETSKPAQATVAPSASLPTFKLTVPETTSTEATSKPPTFTLPGASATTSTEQKKDEKAEAPKVVRFDLGASSAVTTTTASAPTTTSAPSGTSTTTAPPATTAAPPALFPAVTTPATTSTPAPPSLKPSEPPKLSFGFGNTTTGTTPTPLFGAQAASTSSATPTAQANIFGSTQPSTAAADATARPSATPLQPSTGPGLFGAAATTQPTGALFGGATSGGFGTSTPSVFGTAAPKPDASAAKPSFSFGAAATTPSTTTGFTGFGTTAPKPADTAADKPTAGGGLSILGAAQKGPQSSAPTGFGTSTLFGGHSSSSTTSTPAFGQSMTNGTSTTTPAFGQPTTARSSAPAPLAFGQPASTAPTFGQPSSAATGFGAATTAPSMSFGQLSASTPTAPAFGATTPAATTTTFGHNTTTPAVTTPSVATFGANGTTSAFGNAAASAQPKPAGFSFSFGGNTPGANSAPGTPVPGSAVNPTFTFGAGSSKPDGTTSPMPTPSTPGGRALKPLPRARR